MLLKFFKLFLSSFFVSVIWSFDSKAVMTLTSYSNYFYTIETATAGPTVYAGQTSNSSMCNQNGVNPCDSCAAQAGALATGSFCSTNEIYGSLAFAVSVRTDNASVIGQNPSFQICIGSQPLTLTVSPTVALNTEMVASTTWSSLWSAAGYAGGLTSFPAVTLKAGLSTGNCAFTTESVSISVVYRYVASSQTIKWGCSDQATFPYTGFCDLQVGKGDSKIFVTPQFNTTKSYILPNASAASVVQTADASGMKYKSLRVYILETTGAAVPATILVKSNFVDLDYGSRGYMMVSSNNKVLGLTNGVWYSIAGATVDYAGIMTDVMNDGAAGVKIQNVLPEQVYGLLDGQNCFIATAAYGSILGPELNTFRKFRSEFLLKNKWGRDFVNFYYKHSPAMAKFISESEILRFFARSTLLPFLFFAQLSLSFGFIPALLVVIIFSGCFIIFGILFFYKNSFKSRVFKNSKVQVKLK